MTLSQRAVEAALSAYVQHPVKAKGDAMDAMKSALTAALAVDGLCLAPKVATDKMICAALDDYDERYRRHHSQSYTHVWEAMLAAASDGDSPPAGTEG